MLHVYHVQTDVPLVKTVTPALLAKITDHLYLDHVNAMLDIMKLVDQQMVLHVMKIVINQNVSHVTIHVLLVNHHQPIVKLAQKTEYSTKKAMYVNAQKEPMKTVKLTAHLVTPNTV